MKTDQKYVDLSRSSQTAVL